MAHNTPPICVARPEEERIEELISQLRRMTSVRQSNVHIVRAPLRICPLGAHIDHQLGVVTGMTIDQALLLAFVPTDDGEVYVNSINFDRPVRFNVNDVPSYQKGDWGNYVRGAVLALQHNHALRHGLVGVIGSEMPVGGLSSSAAVTIAYLLALQTLNHIHATSLENVKLVTQTEHDYIGLNNGILDQTSILCSKRNHLTRIDCQSRAIAQIPGTAVLDECSIMIVYSGVEQSLVGSDYNNRVAECQEAAQLLLAYSGQASQADPRLRFVDPAIFSAEGHRLPEKLRKRAAHYFGEMQRVTVGVETWQAGLLERFGALMNESGASSIGQYECGSPQLITLYETLADTPGVYGTRFSGAGFRGNCIAFVDPTREEAIADAVHAVYPQRHPDYAAAYSIHFCRPADAATLIV